MKKRQWGTSPPKPPRRILEPSALEVKRLPLVTPTVPIAPPL